MNLAQTVDVTVKSSYAGSFAHRRSLHIPLTEKMDYLVSTRPLVEIFYDALSTEGFSDEAKQRRFGAPLSASNNRSIVWVTSLYVDTSR
jgi:hypothetical protein